MKKTLFFALCCAVALTSCKKQQEVSIPNAGEEAMATFAVAMTPATKATIDNDGAAANVNRCILEVYSNGKVYRHVEVKVDPATLTATFQLPLVISQKYDFLFWADCATLDASLQTFTDLYYDTQNLKAVKILDETSGNLDAKDAFYTYDHNVEFTGTAAVKEYALTRPFAQVNIVTNDLLEIKNSVDQSLSAGELWPAKISVDYTTQFPTQFNVYDGTCSELKTITRKAEAVYGCATAAAYNTLNMDYLFVNATEAPEDPESKAAFAITKADITLANNSVITILNNAENIPIKRNYRTNIIGSFLTDPQDFTVVVNPLWYEPDYNPLPAPPAPVEAQGCTVATNPETGDVVATYTPGSTVVVIPEGVTKFDLNPGSEGGVYNMTVKSLSIPSTLNFANDNMVTGCKNLMSITYNVTGIDFTLENSFLVFTGENGIKTGETLELNFIGIPTSFRFVKYHYGQQQYIDDTSLRILSQTSSAGKIRINLPAGWISASLPYKFQGDGTTPVVVFEDGVQVYPEN